MRHEREHRGAECDPTSFPAQPFYALPDHRGKHRTLSELQGGDPLVPVLSRGSFCPRDRRPFLSDPGRKLQKDLDIAEYTDPHHDPMIRHTLVLEPRLRIDKIYNGYWFFGRPTVEELRLDLRAVLQRCRPDWDISSAEQRTALAKGEKARFFPYGRTQAQVLAAQD